jgi:hypothetical protein
MPRLLTSLIMPLLIIAGLLVVGAPRASAQDMRGPVWMSGDDPTWASPDYDDSGWAPLNRPPDVSDDVFWVRTILYIERGQAELNQPVIALLSDTPLELYIDGHLVGRNGDVDQPDIAVHERIELGLSPDYLTPGPHTMAVRLSSRELRETGLFLLTYELLEAGPLARAHRLRDAVDGAAAGLAGLLVLVFLSIYIAGTRRTDLLVAATICASAFFIIVFNYASRPYSISSDTTVATDLMLALFGVVFFVLTPALLHSRLELQHRARWSGGLALIIAMSFIDVGQLDHDTRAFSLLMLFGLGMCSAAWKCQPARATAHAVGLLAGLVAIILQPDYLRYFLAVLVLALSIGLMVELVHGEITRRRAEARAARLQLALVKRNIQPHFIMNSLMVATELQETDAPAAAKFIGAMSREFRALSTLVDRSVVHLEEELALCRSHLEMMSLRLGARFELICEGIETGDEFPPGVLHTLLENAISHNRYGDAAVTFHFSSTRTGKITTYRLSVPVGKSTPESAVSSGSGSRYVEARLEEFRPGRWSLTDGAEQGHWVTHISLEGLAR